MNETSEDFRNELAQVLYGRQVPEGFRNDLIRALTVLPDKAHRLLLLDLFEDAQQELPDAREALIAAEMAMWEDRAATQAATQAATLPKPKPPRIVELSIEREKNGLIRRVYRREAETDAQLALGYFDDAILSLDRELVKTMPAKLFEKMRNERDRERRRAERRLQRQRTDFWVWEETPEEKELFE